MGQVFTREWKKHKNLKSTMGFTFIWNLISTSLLFNARIADLEMSASSSDSMSMSLSVNPAALVILIFYLFGVGMMYYCTAMWMNKTEIKIEGEKLRLTRGPLYWSQREVEIPLKDIRQAYVEEYTHSVNETHKILFNYRLIVQLHSSGDLVLERDIADPEQAKQLEQWLGEHLKIKDSTMAGEAA